MCRSVCTHVTSYRSSSQEVKVAPGTLNPVNRSVASRQQCSYTAPVASRQPVNQHPKLGNTANKYVYVNNSNKVNNTKPVPTGQLVHRKKSPQNSSAMTNNKFHKSMNNVFRFTASPQPIKTVSTTAKDFATKKPSPPAVNKVSHQQGVSYVSSFLCVDCYALVISANPIQPSFQLEISSNGAAKMSVLL